MASGGDSPARAVRAKEASILNATQRLLGQMGFRELSVARIVREARVSRAEFSALYPTKQAVLIALVTRSLHRIADLVARAGERRAQPESEARIRALILDTAGDLRAERAVLRAAVMNWHAIPELRSAWIAEMERFIASTAASIERSRGARAAAPSALDSSRLAAALVWSTERCVCVAALGESEAFSDDGALADALARMWSAALGARVAD
jgi:AcrR family transcriptional regulator